MKVDDNIPMTLLWADDDSYEALEPFVEDLEDANFRVRRAVDYTGAVKELEGGEIETLLLDIILPHERGSGSLAYDLGIKLADRAADLGVRAIVFLTVVRRTEVLDKYNDLMEKYPRTEFNYTDKTLLLDRKEIVFKFLRTFKD